MYVEKLCLLRHPDAACLNSREQSHLFHGFDGIPADVDRGACEPEVGSAFDHRDIVAAAAEFQRTRQSGYAAARHKNFQQRSMDHEGVVGDG
ncbi:hypothetical protein MMAGJ_20390 [Mycolicibacterium mageritense]|uniref:Uncharacterized protein n=1 Tax=Mycolicibacterium mageritense TaxID=53462 RepID=A0ABM7HQE7_MYCME|nr:hypothetical protein MMAGJ_20390 [Mycolicibacterium mageritense]